jgi:hypothetical protein
MNTRSVREYTAMFAPTQLLRNWREQRPSNKSDIDSSVMWEVGRVYYTGVDLLLISFLYRSSWLMLSCVLNGTSCVTLSLREGKIELLLVFQNKKSCSLYNKLK